MSTFDPNKHPRGNTGHAGQFAAKAQSDAEVGLTHATPTGSGLWTSETIERAAGTISAFDGVDSVTFDPEPETVTLPPNGRAYERLRGRLQYKGHEFEIEVIEKMGTVSGTGYVTVNGPGKQGIAHSTYHVPKIYHSPGVVFPSRPENLGNNIETALLADDITSRLARSPHNADGWARTRMDIHSSGGKAWVSLPGETLGNTSLYYHGGRKWRGYGGIAFGDQAAQRDSVIRGLGQGQATHGRKMLRELDQVMTAAQAAHDREYPPTPAQLKRRRKI